MGTITYSLPHYFAARLKTWSSLQDASERVQEAHGIVTETNNRLLLHFGFDEEKQKQRRRKQSHLALIAYGTILFISLIFWVPSMRYIFVDYHFYYNNYANKFIAHARLLLWAVFSTRTVALHNASLAFGVWLALPMFSVCTALAIYLISREMNRLSDPEALTIASIDLQQLIEESNPEHEKTFDLFSDALNAPTEANRRAALEAAAASKKPTAVASTASTEEAPAKVEKRKRVLSTNARTPKK